LASVNLSRRHLIFALLLAVLIITYPSGVAASPATFVTALPVAQNQGLLRLNAQPGFGPAGYASIQFPVNFAYGLTPNWAIFVNANQGFLAMDKSPSTGGAGDMLLFIRNTLFKIDRPRSTFRIAPLVGASLPTGANQYTVNGQLAPGQLQAGSGTVDPYAGITMVCDDAVFGAAYDATYRHNPAAASGYTPGDRFNTDGQIEFRLLPLHLPEEGLPDELWLSIESNYQEEGTSHSNGISNPGTANKTLRQDAVFEWATLHWEVGAGQRFTVMQNFETPHPVAERTRTFLFFEYYLSMPNWRHRGKR
jgi:hypothetical protein